MNLVRLFLSTAFFLGSIATVALWLFPIVMGRFPLTSVGFALAFSSIQWTGIVAVAAIGGTLRVLSQFEIFRSLCGVSYWIEVFFKAWR